MTKHLGRKSLAARISAALALAAPVAALAGTVSNCNDSGSGSLRGAIANAADGETILFDMAAMGCGTITLTTGALTTELHDLTLEAPAGSPLVISGNDAGRVIAQGTLSPPDSSRTLTLRNLGIAHGYLQSSYGTVKGGCIFTAGGVALDHVHVHDCKVSSASGSAYGGGIAASILVLDHGALTDNVAVAGAADFFQHVASGGGAFVSMVANIQASAVENNRAELHGLGVASGGGLAINPAAAVTIDQSVISGNTASAPAAAGFGGGLYVGSSGAGSFGLAHSTISGNSAMLGGGLYVNAAQMSVGLQNDTITGNTASGAGAGAVVKSSSSGFMNDTIAFNTAAAENSFNGNSPVKFAAGLSTVTPFMLNTIIALNVATEAGDPSGASDLNFTGNPFAAGWNLVMRTLDGNTMPPDTISSNPMLGSLADNGGPTPTLALQSGSPAIDAGTICGPAASMTTDQRGPGYPRRWGSRIDIGAFEYGAPLSGDVIFRDDFNPPSC